MIIKKCLKCGALVKIINDCTCPNCGITCCGSEMREMKANTSDGAVEKHKPTYVIEGNKLIVMVNHVMEKDHYIEWIALVTKDKEEYRYLEPGMEVSAIFDKPQSGIIYSYCNKHGLWMKEIK